LAQLQLCLRPGSEKQTNKRVKHKKNNNKDKTGRPGGDQTSDIQPTRQNMASILHGDGY
jgi:hypothetical protein